MSVVVGDSSLAELHEQRAFLLRSLEDLEAEREAGDVDDADYEALRSSYTARAAAVLRAIGAAEEAPGTSAAADEPAAGAHPRSSFLARGASPRRRWARPLLTVVSVLALAGLAGALMARSAGERLPGEAATGSLTSTGASSDLQRARLLIGEGKTLEAIKTFDKILREDPRQPEALAYRGWLLRLAGRAGGNPSLIDSGMAFIERAVAADPTYPDAHFFRGVILYQDRRDPAGAVAEFRAFLANDPPPEMVPVVEDSLRRALADSQAAGAAPPTPEGQPQPQAPPQP
ncbi:MAG TPA: tetratricopeptide repeat protein [Acidimicrobiales bacterium]|nr:tetratricopeptide repeat protein [Acidimicrobiales bacterium]